MSATKPPRDHAFASSESQPQQRPAANRDDLPEIDRFGVKESSAVGELRQPQGQVVRTVRRYIAPDLGAKRLDRLQSRDVQTWINQVARTCQCCAQGNDASRCEDKRRCCAVGRCCQTVPSTRTVSDIRATLRAALTHAQAEDLISKNPAASVTLATVRRRRGKSWSSDEARKFLESARRDEDPLYAACALVLVTGLRKGEALGLTTSYSPPGMAHRSSRATSSAPGRRDARKPTSRRSPSMTHGAPAPRSWPTSTSTRESPCRCYGTPASP